MSYALSVVPEAAAAINLLDVQAEEAIYDLLDALAAEGQQLRNARQRHLVSVATPTSQSYVRLRIIVDHSARLLRLTAVRAVVI